jgi:hypothetical protein
MASNCYANPNPIFQPAMRLIASITNANPATVTTTFAHQYDTGLIVRLDIPPACGMQGANGMKGAITVIDSTSFSIDIDTSLFDAFSIPVSPGPFDFTCAQVVPIGEVNDTLYLATRNILP